MPILVPAMLVGKGIAKYECAYKNLKCPTSLFSMAVFAWHFTYYSVIHSDGFYTSH